MADIEVRIPGPYRGKEKIPDIIKPRIVGGLKHPNPIQQQQQNDVSDVKIPRPYSGKEKLPDIVKPRIIGGLKHPNNNKDQQDEPIQTVTRKQHTKDELQRILMTMPGQDIQQRTSTLTNEGPGEYEMLREHCEKQLERLDRVIAEKDAVIQRLRQEADAQTNEFARKYAQVADHSSALDLQLQRLVAENNRLQAQGGNNAAASQTIRELELELNTITRERNSLQQERDNLVDERNRLRNALDRLPTQESWQRAQEQIRTLEDEVTSLVNSPGQSPETQNLIAQLRAQKQELEEAHDQLVTELEALEAKVAELTNENKDLAKENDEGIEEYEELEGKYKTLEEGLAEASKAIAEYQAVIAELQAQVSKLKREKQDLEYRLTENDRGIHDALRLVHSNADKEEEEEEEEEEAPKSTPSLFSRFNPFGSSTTTTTTTTSSTPARPTPSSTPARPTPSSTPARPTSTPSSTPSRVTRSMTASQTVKTEPEPEPRQSTPAPPKKKPAPTKPVPRVSSEPGRSRSDKYAKLLSTNIVDNLNFDEIFAEEKNTDSRTHWTRARTAIEGIKSDPDAKILANASDIIPFAKELRNTIWAKSGGISTITPFQAAVISRVILNKLTGDKSISTDKQMGGNRNAQSKGASADKLAQDDALSIEPPKSSCELFPNCNEEKKHRDTSMHQLGEDIKEAIHSIEIGDGQTLSNCVQHIEDLANTFEIQMDAQIAVEKISVLLNKLNENQHEIAEYDYIIQHVERALVELRKFV
jgi:hypothetical protein